MDCVRVSQNLDHYLDGELGWWRAHAVARHLHHCAACSSGFTFEVRVRHTLSASINEPLPAGLESRVLRRLHEEGLPGAGPDLGDPPGRLPGPLGDV